MPQIQEIVAAMVLAFVQVREPGGASLSSCSSTECPTFQLRLREGYAQCKTVQKTVKIPSCAQVLRVGAGSWPDNLAGVRPQERVLRRTAFEGAAKRMLRCLEDS